MDDKYNLARFIEAQADVYPSALEELQKGRKQSHWMWYIFPQLRHLGYSRLSEYYGLSGTDEASAYLQNQTLNSRLREVCETILVLPTNDACAVFGEIDSYKLRSSMTIFDRVSPNDLFARVLEKYFDGERDDKTLEIIETQRSNEII